MFCMACGAKNEENDRFCVACGAPLHVDAPQETAGGPSTPQITPVASVPPVTSVTLAAPVDLTSLAGSPSPAGSTQPVATLTAPARHRKAIIACIIAAIAVIALVVSLGVTHHMGLWGGRTVPDTTAWVDDEHLTADAAAARLKEQGFAFKRDQAFSGKKKGTFLGLSGVKAGDRLKSGEKLTLLESAGPGVPDGIVGKSVKDAAKAVKDMGVPVYAKRVAASPDADENTVVASYPAEGRPLEDDDEAIYLGVPDSSIEGMPADIIGMDKDDAQHLVEQIIGESVRMEPRFSDEAHLGKIIDSNYTPGVAFASVDDDWGTSYAPPVILYYGVGADDTDEVMTDSIDSAASVMMSPWRVAGTYCKDGSLPGSDGCITFGMHGSDGHRMMVREAMNDEDINLMNDEITLCTPTGDIGGCILRYEDGSVPDDKTNMANHLLAKDWGMFEMYEGYGWPMCGEHTFRGYGLTGGCYDGTYLDDDMAEAEGFTPGEQSGARYDMRDFYVYFPVGSDIKALEDSGYFSDEALSEAKKAGDPDTSRPFIIMRDNKDYQTTSVDALKDGELMDNPFVPGIAEDGSNPLVQMKTAPSAESAYYLVDYASQPGMSVGDCETWADLGDAEVAIEWIAKDKSAGRNDAPKITKRQLSDIADEFSTDDVAVSAMAIDDFDSDGLHDDDGDDDTDVDDLDADDIDTSDTAQATKQFVAAGLYLPVYLASRGNSDAEGLANTMMSTMDNTAGNQAVQALGGWSAVNSWLSSHGYSGTNFQRDFGDVAASNAGTENYSTSRDATRMLVAVDAAGGTDLLNANIVSEGVTIPEGMTVHAHRGMGIQDTWNYFAIVEVDGQKAAVSVVTQNQGKERAAELMSRVLESVNDTVRR